jgi:O-antigen ligase
MSTAAGPDGSSLDSSLGAAPASVPSALPARFYHLTLLAALVSVIEIRLRPLPGLPSFSLLELVAIPTLLAVLTEMVLRPRMAASLTIYRENRPLAWYVGYAGLASVVGLVRSSDSMQAFHDLFPAFALYVLVLVTVDTRARLMGFLATNLAVALPGLGLALLQSATGGFYLLPRSENIEGKLDLAGEVASNAPTGLGAHPNGLALYLLPIALFLAVGAWRGFAKDRRSSLAVTALLVATIIVLKAAFARGVYAWLTVGTVFLVLPRWFDRWRFWIALIAPFLGIALLVWLSVYSLLQGDLQYGTIVSRIELWFSALDILQSDRFVMVLGSGCPQLLTGEVVSFDYPNPHNAWLGQALTYGVPALIFYLAAFGSAFRSLAQRLRSGDAPTRAIALATMASLMAVLGENFFEPADRGSTFQSQLFMLFAVAARAAVPSRPDQRAPDPVQAPSFSSGRS